MKKAIGILMILVLAITIFSCSKDKANDLINSKLNGEIKYFEEKQYSVYVNSLGKIKDDYRIQSFVRKYNKKGNLVSSYDRIDKIQYVYSYNFRNTLKELVSTWFYLKDLQHSKGVLKYDFKGNKIEMKNYRNGDFEGATTYEYDGNGNMIEEKDFNKIGDLKTKCTYEYDDRGNRTAINSFITFDEIDKKTIFEYDAKSSVVVRREYEYKDLVERNTFKHDSYGNEIEWCLYDGYGDLIDKTIMKHEYDKNNNPISTMIYDKDNIPITSVRRTFVYYGDKDENEFQDWENEMKKTVNK